jgi:hypothetical protein
MAAASSIPTLNHNLALTPQAKFWHDERSFSVLGMCTVRPGPPVSTAELLARLEGRFGANVSGRGMALAKRLGIATRHICRDFQSCHESPREGNSNPDLAAASVRLMVASGRRSRLFHWLDDQAAVFHTTQHPRYLRFAARCCRNLLATRVPA